MKTINFITDSDIDSFNYETMEELKTEALKYNIYIGDDVSIEDNVSIGTVTVICNGVNIHENAIIGKNCHMHNNVSIRKDVNIEDNVTINHHSRIRNGVKIGSHTTIGCHVVVYKYVTIGEVANISHFSKVNSNIKGMVIETIHFDSLYRYQSDIIITDKETYIRMGCYVRTVAGWKANFWNNNIEFPKDSEEGVDRLKAFNTKMYYLGLPILEN